MKFGSNSLHCPFYHHLFPVMEIIGQDMLACLLDQPYIECQIMERCYLQGKVFLGLEEMVQIGFCVKSIYKRPLPLQ